MDHKIPVLRPTSRYSQLSFLLLLVLGCKSPKLVDAPECVPQVEVCDGQDNDCDGAIDFYGVKCGGACGGGMMKCVEGELQACNAPSPKLETCNGIDDDCDGIVDNSPAVEFCYTGAQTDLTATNSPCRPGILRCEMARKVCRGQVLPVGEVCNGLDDDCDGVVDDGVATRLDVDIVMVIDNSGSMTNVINSVASVVSTFQQKYAGRTDLHWALVAAPDKDLTLGSYPRVQVDFTDPAKFSTSLNQQAATGSGEEATIDAIDMLISPANELGLAWRQGARKSIVMFTDEVPQNYFTTETYSTLEAKIAATPMVDVRVFTTTSAVALDTYTQWTQAVGPSNVFNIHAGAAAIALALENIIMQNSCN